ATCRDVFAGQGTKCVHLLDLLFNKNPTEQAVKVPNTLEVATKNMKILNQWVRSLAEETKKVQVLTL
ncbi:MAG TPA: hypothetical protein VIL99_08885, partial [Ignavibacteria bacterium]